MNSTEELEKKLFNDIELYGWHVIKVPEDEMGPSLGYSIGFYHTFQHPEILIVGLDIELIHYLINRIGDAIREGIQFHAGYFYANIIEDVACYFTEVDPKFHKEYIAFVELFYKGIDVPILQCIYPTVSGIYPWQPKWPPELKGMQPVLGAIPTPKSE
jgi:hypothetical protein